MSNLMRLTMNRCRNIVVILVVGAAMIVGLLSVSVSIAIAADKQESQDKKPEPEKKKAIAVKEKDGTLLLSIRAKNVSIRELIQELADLRKINLVLDPDVSGTISMSVTDVTWDSLLAVILESSELAADIDEKVLYLHKPR